MEKTRRTITILKELEDLIVPLSKEEFVQLEENIIKHGCREPLVVWQRSESKLILVDGHNRHKICEKHNIPFKTEKVKFKDIEEVKVWMIDNQFGRRNLNPDQLSYYRGLRYITLRRKRGGFDNVRSKGQSDTSTAEALSAKFVVSERTIKRDAKFAEGLDIIARSNPKLKIKILSGDIKVKRTDVQVLAQSKNPDKITIRNEADLFNKAKVIRESIIDELEKHITTIENNKVEAARKILNEREPLFLNKEDRVKKIKGRIISAINRAINNKDLSAMKELKNLIGSLEDEIFD